MQNVIRLMQSSRAVFLSALVAALVVGCQSGKKCCAKAGGAKAGAEAKAEPAKAARPTIRIEAGGPAYTDANGNAWLADQGFEGGDNADRGGEMQIENTKDPAIYRTEHWGMTTFSQAVPNGKYTVKLHFAETWEGITGPGQRVFSFNVEGQEFKDFDVWTKAGGKQKAYIETVNVEVTDGKLDITFVTDKDNPEINGIEIIPAS